MEPTHATNAMAQDPIAAAKRALDIPFSDAELLTAYRLSMSDKDAEAAVRELRHIQAVARAAVDRYMTNPEEYIREQKLVADESPMFGIALTDDTLIILSLLSDELERRVAQYRNQVPRNEASIERLWQERREQLRPWVRARLKARG